MPDFYVLCQALIDNLMYALRERPDEAYRPETGECVPRVRFLWNADDRSPLPSGWEGAEAEAGRGQLCERLWGVSEDSGDGCFR